MEMEGISNLGQVVGTNVGVRQGLQRRERRRLHCCYLGVVHCILKGRIGTQRVTVITSFIGCRGSDLAPALLLTLFHLLYAPQHVLLPLRPCPTFLHTPPMFSDHLRPSHRCRHALFVFVVVPVAEHSFPCHACRWHPILYPPLCPWSFPSAKSPCEGDWSRCQCGRCWVGGKVEMVLIPRPIVGSNGRRLHPSQLSSLGQCLVGIVCSAALREGLRTGGGDNIAVIQGSWGCQMSQEYLK